MLEASTSEPTGGAHAGERILAPTAAVLACAAAQAAAAAKPTPPASTIGTVKFVNNLPEMKWATAINVLQYRGRDVMYVAGRFGLRSYDRRRLAGEPASGARAA